MCHIAQNWNSFSRKPFSICGIIIYYTNGSRVCNKVCKSRRQKLWSRQVIDDERKVTCNAGVFWGWVNAIATILDFKRRERLARVERATKGEGVSSPKILQIQQVATITEILALTRPQENACIAG